jgi:cytochrome c peroxidase
MKKKCSLLLIIAFLFSAFTLSLFHGFISPPHFPHPVYSFEKNPLTEEKVALGRFLFYDPLLSQDSSISCASCHSPYNAFAHTDHELSHGINDEIGTRNAPALFNLAWQSNFMWDGAINHLDMQALAPISHAKEMNETLEHVVQKLQSKPFYTSSFKRAFGDGNITGEHVLKALAQFQLTLVSANSTYDRVQEGSENFTDQEQRGYTLFQHKCAACHREPLFSTYEFANNGILLDSTLNDLGRGEITQKNEDNLQFKIPSLRNLRFTYPYMHDGRYKKLSTVLRHYANGEFNEHAKDVRLQNTVGLSTHEQVDILSFLRTLDDKDFVFNQKHQFPKELLNHAKD